MAEVRNSKDKLLMKVSELIERLMEYSPDCQVVCIGFQIIQETPSGDYRNIAGRLTHDLQPGYCDIEEEINDESSDI